jgi:ubiquinone/menaquinone biosynthesis C-methylase UbiE
MQREVSSSMVDLARDGFAPPFDAAAASYDASFTDSLCGRALRESVWSRLVVHIRGGMDVLDLGCGTGEDAIWLARHGCNVLALDSSSAMLDVAAAKIDDAGLNRKIRLRSFDFNRDDFGLDQAFDLVLSNFGAMNCAKDPNRLGQKLARCLRPGGKAAIVFMGRFCALETLYHVSRFDGAAGRRWSGKAMAKVGDRLIDIRYFTVGELTRAMPAFRAIGAFGIGVLLPPSYLFHLARRRPSLFAALARWDRAVAGLWPLSRMGDHTLLLLERRKVAT